jgi:hypothetical protein
MKATLRPLATTLIVLLPSLALMAAEADLRPLVSQLPLYPGARMVEPFEMEGDDTLFGTLELGSSRDKAGMLKRIAAFYKRELPPLGWHLQSETSEGDDIALRFSRERYRLEIDSYWREDSVRSDITLLGKGSS